MAKVTQRGREFAQLIAPFVGLGTQGSVDFVPEICSLIARLATTHHRLAKCACNRGLTPAEERQDQRIETRIRTLVARLPRLASGKRIGVEFQGDPRGFTVQLVVPGDKGGNTWGLDGRYGV